MLLAVSVDFLVLGIVFACLVAGAVFNRIFPPLGAWVAATLVGTLLAVTIYTAPRFVSEGWSGTADDLSHPLFWIAAFAIASFIAVVTTGGFSFFRWLRNKRSNQRLQLTGDARDRE